MEDGGIYNISTWYSISFDGLVDSDGFYASKHVDLDLPKGAKWRPYRVSIDHLLGFNWHFLWKVLVYMYVLFE